MKQNKNNYIPQPVDTNDIVLPQELQGLSGNPETHPEAWIQDNKVMLSEDL